MPEVPIDEHHNPCASEDDVRSAGKASRILPVAEASREQSPAHRYLDPRVFAADTRH